MLNLPFALIGGVLALYLSGLYLSVPASVGFIALFGIAVLNGIVLLSYITQLREEGRPLGEAIVEGCSNRLRPVLMTATITDLQPRAAALRPGARLGDPAAAGGRRGRRADLLDPADAPRAAGALQLVRREAEGEVTGRKGPGLRKHGGTGSSQAAAGSAGMRRPGPRLRRPGPYVL